MKTIIFLAIVVTSYYGYLANGWFGLATGIVAPLAIGSAFLISIGKGDGMSINRKLRLKQSIGGIINLFICFACLYIGGWKLGWLWVPSGYIIGTIISYFMAKPILNEVEETSEKMVESFISNAKSNLGYKPDDNSINFLKNNSELSALIWDMLGETGGNINIGINNNEKWSKECDYFYNNYVQNETFKSTKPGAHALIRYVVYLCDEDKSRCSHPADDL